MGKVEGTLPTATCKRCGHHWVVRTLSPVECPSCRSYKWDTAGQPERVADVGATYGKQK